MRVGLYARVSTHDQQTLPLQTQAMQAYAKVRDWQITMQVGVTTFFPGKSPLRIFEQDFRAGFSSRKK